MRNIPDMPVHARTGACFRPPPLQRSGLTGVLLALILVLAGTGIAGCANPSAPTGGPRDTTPPVLERLTPADDSVNVSVDTDIVLRFDKHIERSTAARAFSMTPEPERPPRFDFSGRTITVSFPEPLRDSTTYIVTFDTDLRDVRSVNLDEPLIFAFATGPQIDQGRIEGRIVEPERGAPEQGVDVFAYALPPGAAAPPDTLPEAPDFRTQTGSDGTFTFRNIREEPYYVIGVRDDNRNRFPDPNEAYAVPPVPVIEAVEAPEPTPVPWLLTRPAPSEPRAERVRPRTERRQHVRFNQPVAWTERSPEAWVLVDSVAQDTIGIRSVYTSFDTPFEVGVEAEQALREEQVHRLTVPPSALADSLGRAVPDTTLRFTPSTAADEGRPELVGFRPDRSGGEAGRPLTREEAPHLHVTLPLSSDVWNADVTAADTAGTPRTISASSADGLRYRIDVDPPLEPGMPVDLRIGQGVVSEEDTVFTQRFRRLDREELGEIEFTVDVEQRRWPERESPATDEPVSAFAPITRGWMPDALYASLPFDQEADGPASPQNRQQQPPDESGTDLSEGTLGTLRAQVHDLSRNSWPTRHIRADTAGVMLVDRVPEGEYRIRVVLDRNDTGGWSPGQLAPYEPADAVTWSEQTIEGRARWTNVLEQPLRIILLAD